MKYNQILYHFSTPRWHKYLTSSRVEEFVLYYIGNALAYDELAMKGGSALATMFLL